MKKLLLVLSLFCSVVFADPIIIFSTAPAGGNIDGVARVLNKELNDNGYDSSVITQSGANGDIAYNQTMTRPNSIMVGALHNIGLSHVLSERENFHVKTMKLIGPIIEFPFGFISGTKGFTSFEEMIQYAKINPLPCGTPGATVIELQRINQLYGTKFESVPYRGAAQMKMDLLNNELKCGFDGVGVFMQEYTNKTVKFLAVNNPVKDVPLIKNTLKNYKYEAWSVIGIPNNSKLLEDEKFMNILTKITKNDRMISFASSRDLHISTPDNDINERVVRWSNQYMNLK